MDDMKIYLVYAGITKTTLCPYPVYGVSPRDVREWFESSYAHLNVYRVELYKGTKELSWVMRDGREKRARLHLLVADAQEGLKLGREGAMQRFDAIGQKFDAVIDALNELTEEIEKLKQDYQTNTRFALGKMVDFLDETQAWAPTDEERSAAE